MIKKNMYIELSLAYFMIFIAFFAWCLSSLDTYMSVLLSVQMAVVVTKIVEMSPSSYDKHVAEKYVVRKWGLILPPLRQFPYFVLLLIDLIL